MNYFNELLDSYNKLKKRSFKLRYISEAEEKKASKKKAASTPAKTPEQKKKEEDNQSLEKAKALAEKYVGSAPQVPPQEPDTVAWVQREASTIVKNLAGAETSMRIYKSKGGKSAGLGDVMVMGLSPRGIVSLNKGGALTKHFEDFVKRIAGEEKGGEGADGEAIGEEEAARIAEEARQAQLEEKIGGAEEIKLLKERAAELGRDRSDLPLEETQAIHDLARERLSPTEIDEYKKQLKIVDQFCKDAQQNGGELPADLEKPCSRAISYIAGGANTSLEYKLANGATVCIDPETHKKTNENCEVPVGLKAAVVESGTNLMQFLQPGLEQADCAQIQNSVGRHGNKIVLFGDDTSTGMVMNANSLQRLAVKNVIEKCKTTLADIVDTKFSNADMNAVKGTLYELIPSLTLRMEGIAQAAAEGDKAGAKKLGKDTAQWLQSSIKENNIPLLEQLAAEMPSRDIDGYVGQVIAQGQLDTIHNSTKLRDFLLSEVAVMRGWLQGTGAAAVVHMGLAPESGAREDNGLLFRTPEEATNYADAYSSEVSSRTVKDIVDKAPPNEKKALEKRLKTLGFKDSDEVYLAGFGQKRYKKFKPTKGGETGSMRRQEELTGLVDVTGPLKGVEDGFIEKIATDLYQGDEARQQAQQDYGRGLEGKILKNTESLAEPTTYVNTTKNKIKVSSPQVACQFVKETLAGSLSFDQLSETSVGKLFFNKTNPRDLKDPEVQQRIQEGVQRHARFGAMKRDLQNPTKQQAVTDNLIRNLMADAYNNREMTQVMQDDAGQLVAFSQNGPMQKIIKAQKRLQDDPEALQIDITGATATFVVDGVPLMKWSQEGNWISRGGKSQRITRSLSTFLPACWEGKNNLYKGGPPSIKKEDIFYEFLKGQQMLLEKLLTPSTEHHSFQV